MNIGKILLTTSVLGLAAAAANAQVIPALTNLGASYIGTGDLDLGFSNTVTPPSLNGVAVDLIFDVGNATDYYSAYTVGALASENQAVSGGLAQGTTYQVAAFDNQDLLNVYGSNAYSSNTKWAVVGGNGAGGGPVAESATTLWTTDNSTAFAVAAKSSSLQASPSNKLFTTVGSQVGGGTLAGQSLISTDANLYGQGGSTSFTSDLGVNGNLNSFSGFHSGTGATSTTLALASSGTSSMTLYMLTPTNNLITGLASSVDLGTFTLTTAGLFFTTPGVAIPEPSTYAAILGALTIGFVMVRRRMQNAGLNVAA